MAPAGDNLIQRTADFIDANGLLRLGQTVVLGVSGGADSVALAAVLHAIGRYHLHVAHIHHGLRADADADAAFVMDLARRWSLPVSVRRVDVNALAQAQSLGVEEAARKARYEALIQIAREARATAVAVAHHADDQAETVLHRIIRGTHLRGLGGMPARRELAPGIDLVRPLLWARRADVEEFCRLQGLTWRTDHTNAQTDYTRNFLRLQVLPLLKERLNPRVEEALVRLADAASQAERTLDELAGELWQRSCRKQSASQVILRVAPLKKAPRLLTSMALRKALEHLQAPQRELGQDRFDDLLGLVYGSGRAVDLPGQFRAIRQGQDLVLSRPDAPGNSLPRKA